MLSESKICLALFCITVTAKERDTYIGREKTWENEEKVFVLMFEREREIVEERVESVERTFGREQKNGSVEANWDPLRRHKRFISDSDQLRQPFTPSFLPTRIIAFSFFFLCIR